MVLFMWVYTDHWQTSLCWCLAKLTLAVVTQAGELCDGVVIKQASERSFVESELARRQIQHDDIVGHV